MDRTYERSTVDLLREENERLKAELELRGEIIDAVNDHRARERAERDDMAARLVRAQDAIKSAEVQLTIMTNDALDQYRRGDTYRRRALCLVRQLADFREIASDLSKDHVAAMRECRRLRARAERLEKLLADFHRAVLTASAQLMAEASMALVGEEKQR